jgi:uncharacterized protein YqfA (UPF0365 family)
LDWSKIKTEYITDESTSYRKLAKKYGINYTTIGEKARKEGWKQEREQFQTKSLSKTLNKIAERQSDRAAKFFVLTDALYDKLVEALKLVDPNDTQGLRQLTASVKDWRDMHSIKSDADMREQEARIRNLEKQAQADEESNDVVVTIASEAEEFSA